MEREKNVICRKNSKQFLTFVRFNESQVDELISYEKNKNKNIACIAQN